MAASPRLPAKLTLPSGAVLSLRPRGGAAPLVRAPGAALFSEAVHALTPPDARVALSRGGKPVDVQSLPLRDFHVLRAVLARSDVIAEEHVEVSCRNCAEPIEVRPCAALEVGPWADGELGDPELDTTPPLGEPVEIPQIALGRVRTARTVTFEDRTVAQASELFVAAARDHLVLTPEVVRAMGVVALGTETDAQKICRALVECDDDAFHAVGDAFLAAHYVLRLGAVVFCKACGARNDVDAPYERESGGRAEVLPPAGDEAFPNFDAFATRAKEIAQPMLDSVLGEPAELVVEGGTPAVDDGGEPLLGSYVPPHPGDSGTPTQSPLVTVYYRTFLAMWNEDGAYDWEDELTETIEHELDHHVSFLRGDDPTDDEERAVIREEAVRIVGRREVGRRAIEGFGASWIDFLRRTWPLWVLAVLALLLTLATQR